ncbi:hypothetical protein NL676_006385 [Syzygium grande]|nr:hypothetical protein NL676_006385 [Syzygium grande]
MRTLLSVRKRSSEARPETQAVWYRVNTVESAVARGWLVRELKRTKTRVQVQRRGVAGEVGHELDVDAREGRVGDQKGMRRREAEGAAAAERGWKWRREVWTDEERVEAWSGGLVGEDRGGRGVLEEVEVGVGGGGVLLHCSAFVTSLD